MIWFPGVRPLAIALGVIAFAATAIAADSMADAVATRQAHYKELGGTFRGLNDELKKDAPDKAMILASATKAKDLATALPTWFPKGSGPEAGVKTAAKPEIWSDAAGFAAAAAKLQAETGKLQTVAAAGDIDAIKAQARIASGACKNCHDQFRGADQH